SRPFPLSGNAAASGGPGEDGNAELDVIAAGTPPTTAHPLPQPGRQGQCTAGTAPCGAPRQGTAVLSPGGRFRPARRSRRPAPDVRMRGQGRESNGPELNEAGPPRRPAARKTVWP